ncbi:hypothetical protein PGN35_006850 [Nodosilinea sp. PGN35]|uniref:hypothetical protein n=1 Tax=Nodosilinea sp. PGN35 TaxID=3020489 RepID=UPI0023B34D70|nr:hypothetical protein [Nodosilinea sp. TSF1-S3]MDF0365979.1 hypothetical protein [Nodosilinea sp. TSF1-S3]
MAEPVTIADIYALFQASRAEDDRRAAEADRRMAALNAEADRRAAEADRRAAEADRRAAEADRRLQKLERIAANTSREVAGLTTRWGQFVENLVAPAVIRLFQERGIEVQELSRRMQSNRPGAEMEIDIFAVDGDVAVAVECKSRLSKQDVDDFLARLGRFRQAFPHYTGYQIYGAMAGIEIDKGIDRYAYQQGLFVIKQMGDTVAIANDTAFQPAAW